MDSLKFVAFVAILYAVSVSSFSSGSPVADGEDLLPTAGRPNRGTENCIPPKEPLPTPPSWPGPVPDNVQNTIDEAEDSNMEVDTDQRLEHVGVLRTTPKLPFIPRI